MSEPGSYHPRWLATLDSPKLENFEFQDEEGVGVLRYVFHQPPLAVVRAPNHKPEGEGTRIYLSSDRFDSVDDIDAAKRLQSELLDVLNGYCRMIWPSMPKIESHLLIELAPDGAVAGRHITVVPEIFVFHSGDPVIEILFGDEEAPYGKCSPMPADIADSLSHAAVSRALAFFGNSTPSWTEMYAVYEIIQEDIGGNVEKRGWSTKTNRELFERTAQHPKTAGLEARHGEWPHPPPEDPMSLQDARTWMRKVLAKWIRSIANSS